MPTRVIDTHTHWSPPALLDVLEQRTAFPRISWEGDTRLVEVAPGSSLPLTGDFVDEAVKLSKMDACGIDVAVLSVVGGISALDLLGKQDQPPVAREANEELAALVNRHSGRLAGLAALPVQVPDKAAEELEYAVQALGLKGAMVYSNVVGRTLDDPAFRPIFEAAARLDVPIQIHPTHPLAAPWLESAFLTTSVGFLFDTTTAALKLIAGGIYDELPNLKLQLSHVGSLLPYVMARLDQQASDFPSEWRLDAPPSEYIPLLYTDSVCLWPPALGLAIDVFGAEHVMFGTDDPYWPSQPGRDTVDALALEEKEAEQVHWRTAATLFALDGAEP